MVRPDQDFKIRTTSRGNCFQLPCRDLGEIRKVGWIALGMATVAVLFLIFWIQGPVLVGLQMIQGGDPIGWFFVLFGATGILGLVPAAGIWIGSLAVLRQKTWCEIHLEERQLVDIQRLGWLFWRSRYPLDEIRQLTLAENQRPDQQTRDQDYAIWKIDQDLSAIAVQDKQKSLLGLVAAGYSREYLMAFAPQLVAAMNQLRPARETIKWESPESRISPVVAQPDASSESTDAQRDTKVDAGEWDLPPKPVETRMELIETPGQPLVLKIPEMGFRGFARIVFLVGSLWTLGSLVFATAFVIQEVLGKPWDAELLGKLLVVVLVPLIGPLVAYIGWGMSRSSAMIGIDSRSLFWEIQGVFRKRWRQFASEDIRSVRVGNSNTEVNGRPLKALEVIDRDGQRHIDFVMLEEAELEWIAAVIRREMKISNQNGDLRPDWTRMLPSDDVFQLPAHLPLRLNRGMDKATLTVPPIAFWKIIPGLVIGTIFLAIGLGVGYFQFPFVRAPMLGLMALCFTVVGLAILISSWVYRGRWFELTVEGQRLEMVRHHSFRPPLVLTWTVGQLKSIDIYRSGVESNRKPIFALKIRSRSQPDFQLMWGRSGEELSAAMAFLHHHLPGLTGPETSEPTI